MDDAELGAELGDERVLPSLVGPRGHDREGRRRGGGGGGEGRGGGLTHPSKWAAASRAPRTPPALRHGWGRARDLGEELSRGSQTYCTSDPDLRRHSPGRCAPPASRLRRRQKEEEEWSSLEPRPAAAPDFLSADWPRLGGGMPGRQIRVGQLVEAAPSGSSSVEHRPRRKKSRLLCVASFEERERVVRREVCWASPSFWLLEREKYSEKERGSGY